MQSRIDLGVPPPLTSLFESECVTLFLDFDGTLVELAPAPDAIEPVADLAQRLNNLTRRLDGRLAVISGRSIDDIIGHIGPIDAAMAGSHGSDIRDAKGDALVDASGGGAVTLPPVIETALRDYAKNAGVRYEHKPHGGALHYRNDPSAGPGVHAFAEKLAAQHGWMVQSGKCVAELVAKGASKGGAVAALMATAPFAGTVPFFFGDDLTDEAGFRACRAMGGAGILVGSRDETDAEYSLNDVAAVHAWLEL
ncbi:MAG: trehalose-phosphatase [Erythrobacter sp.]